MKAGFRWFKGGFGSKVNPQVMRKVLFGASLALGLHQLRQDLDQQAEMCGIVGYLGDKKRAFEALSNGIKILENRGYDSCGRQRSSRHRHPEGWPVSSYEIRNHDPRRRLHRPPGQDAAAGRGPPRQRDRHRPHQVGDLRFEGRHQCAPPLRPVENSLSCPQWHYFELSGDQRPAPEARRGLQF